MSQTLLTTTLINYAFAVAVLLAYARTARARRIIANCAWCAAGVSLVAALPLVTTR